MHIIPMLSIFIFYFYLCHQCHSAENEHHHSNASAVHTTENHWLLEDNIFLNESFKSLTEIKNLSKYMKTFGEDICHGWNTTEKSQILILVDSNTEHELLRQEARTTWLRNFQGVNNKVRVVFFLGKTHSLDVAERLLMENRKYGDMVWTHVPETSNYYNALKMVSGLQWVHNKCKHAKFVLKVDDRSIVNIPAVMTFIDLQPNNSNTIWGYTHRFLLDAEYYIYACRHAYLMTDDVVKKLYSGALNKIPYMSDENQFLTGFVADNQGIKVIHDKHFEALTLSSILPANSTANAKCDYSKNHMVFLNSKHKDEWAHIVSSFEFCGSTLTMNATHRKSD